MTGLLSPNVASYPGNPNGVSTSIVDVVPGTLVFDTTTGALWRKVSPRGDNSLYVLIGGNKVVAENFDAYASTAQVSILTATGLTRATTANLLHLLWSPGGNIFAYANLGTQTLAPVITADGLDISADQSDDEGIELFSNFAGASGRPFIVGLDPAFYFKATVNIADVSGTDTFLVGFRRAEVNNGTLANYSDYCGVGFNSSASPAAIKLIAEVNGSAPSNFPVDTTQTVADGIDLNVKVLVSAAGAVTFQLSTGSSSLAAPTVTEAMTLDTGDPVIPFIHMLNTADIAGAVAIKNWEVGYS